jgi:hypothetical protein
MTKFLCGCPKQISVIAQIFQGVPKNWLPNLFAQKVFGCHLEIFDHLMDNSSISIINLAIEKN